MKEVAARLHPDHFAAIKNEMAVLGRLLAGVYGVRHGTEAQCLAWSSCARELEAAREGLDSGHPPLETPKRLREAARRARELLDLPADLP